MGHGAGNEYQLKTVKADSIEFAGFTVLEPAIAFAYGGTDADFTADRLGILGNSLFRNFVLFVDYGNERVILEKGERFNQPWPEDNSGLNVGWTIDRGGVEILYVSPDTPAEAAGFRKGDIIKSVNGNPISPRDGVIEVRNLCKGKPGTVHEIVVERAGRLDTLALELEDLF
jgi:membrane-associated protease RseP (regulator of RpoE activity)